jgi:hypothetical protein
LKNLAAHNHLSTRTEFMLLHATRGFPPVRSDQVGAGASAAQSSIARPHYHPRHAFLRQCWIARYNPAHAR